MRGVEAMVTAKMMQSKQTEAIIVLAGTDGTDNHLNQKEVEEGVDEGGFAVVDVGDDGDVSELHGGAKDRARGRIPQAEQSRRNLRGGCAPSERIRHEDAPRWRA